MTIREMTAHQIVCDHCGRTADDLGAEYSWWLDADDANEAWADAYGIAAGGRHACDSPECGRAVLDSHPDLIARSAANGADRWWVIFDRRWSEYVAFFAYRGGPNLMYRGGPILIDSDRSLATVMDEVWAW